MNIRKTFVAHTAVNALASFALTSALFAQSPSTSVDVQLVEVPVNVVDRSGAPVRGLSAENFELRAGGKVVPITHFEEIDRREISSAAASARSPVARRTFILVFDLTSSTPTTILRARDAAENFLRSGLRPGDLAAVATFRVDTGFRLLTNLTSDGEMLAGAVRTLGHPSLFRTEDPLLLAANISEGSAVEGSVGGPGGEAGGGAGLGGDYVTAVLEMANQNARLEESYQRRRIERQLTNFGEVARMLDAVPGRKQILLLSEGFDSSLLYGRESIGSAAAQRDSAAVASGEIWNVDNDRRFGSAKSGRRLEQMGDLFKRSDVVLHALDIQGLRSGVDARAGARQNSNEGLHLIANATGGEVFKNSNDIAENFDRLLEQQEVVYVLGFRPPATRSPGTFHEIRVRLRGVPGGRAFHRAGYYELGSELPPIAETLATGVSLLSDVPRDEIRANVMAAPFPAADGDPQVPVVIEIDGPSLLRHINAAEAELDIFVYAFDQQNRVRDFTHQRITLDLAKVRGTLGSSGVKYYGALDLPPGEYVLRSLVRERSTGRSGSNVSEFEVPDFQGQVLLPPFVVEPTPEWIMVRAPETLQSGREYPYSIGGEGFIPYALPAVASDGELEVVLYSYGLPVQGMQLAATVESAAVARRAANVALVGRSPAEAGDPTKLLFRFRPSGLAPGRYTLTFSARNDDAGFNREVSVPVVVR